MTARSPTGTNRWQLGLRAAVAMAVPVAVGWAAGDIGAGLIASLGGRSRPASAATGPTSTAAANSCCWRSPWLLL